MTTENRPQEIQAFWQQLELRFDVLLDEQEELSQALMVRNLPTTVIVDAHGNLTGRVMGQENGITLKPSRSSAA